MVRRAGAALLFWLVTGTGCLVGDEIGDPDAIGATEYVDIDWVQVHEFGDVEHVVLFPTDASPVGPPGDAFRLRVLSPGARSWVASGPAAWTGGEAPTGERAIRIERGDHGTAAIYTRFPGLALDDSARTTACLGIRFWGVSGASASVADVQRDGYTPGPDDPSDIAYLGGVTVIGDRMTVRRPLVGVIPELSVPIALGSWNVLQFEFRGGDSIAVRSGSQWLTVRERSPDEQPLRLGLVSLGLNAWDLTADLEYVRTVALVRGPCP